jgi:energy-coupling factor transporter ATP-binding protein EcfA2
MFNKDDEKYLLRQISNNQVVLFLGAGFSRDSYNQNGTNFPTAWELGNKLWEFLSYEGEYDDTPLPQMYQRFLNAGIKRDEKRVLLDENLLSGEIPDAYNAIAIPYWFKIYTINVDDIISKVFRRQQKSLKELRYPADQYYERDQTLETTQIVYLHGKLPCDPNEIIFSTQQYAKAQLSHQPLYAQFVFDYATLPTIFIGTELDEPLFERYIEARESKFGFRELRPKSYLITPDISPVKADILKENQNVYHIPGTSSDFFSWLESKKDVLPDRIEILRETHPNLLGIAEYADLYGLSKKTIRKFASAFKRVPKEFKIVKERSGFLSGASPRWNDIVRELDIPRNTTSEIYNKIDSLLEAQRNEVPGKTTTITLSGYAGSGKSTILKRLGLMLSQSGRTVFLSYSDFIPSINELIDVLNNFEEKVVLLFDNSKNILSMLPNLITEFNNQLKSPPIIVLSIRSNFYNRLEQYISPEISNRIDYKIPDLNDQEIKALIDKLDSNNLLGVLKGESSQERFKQFKYRAHRQILIAMKEATNGQSFNDIIKDEFSMIEPFEAKILTLCISLNTELGFTNSKQDLVGFSKVSHIEALNYLESVLQGTIIWVGSGRKFMLRHKILADYIIRFCAELELLKEAYIRVLSVLAPELKRNHGNNRKFNLFKALISHKILYRRFKSDIEHAREVYDSITEFFSDDAHFWLQYGSLEIEGKGGDLNLAENYLNQAESLAPKSNYIKNAKCNLLYKQSSAATNLGEAIELKDKADQIAQKLLLGQGNNEPYIFHIYCAGRYNFIKKWVTDHEQKKQMLNDLRKTIKTATTLHPFNNRLKVASEAINRAYIQMGISNEDLEDPDIPDYAEPS